MPNSDDSETCELDVYWTVGDGQRWSISLSKVEASQDLEEYANCPEFDEVKSWSIEKTREIVPVVIGELAEGEGEAISLDDNGVEVSRQSYQATHVFWKCPHCGENHNGNIHQDRINRSSPIANPSLWFCEQGEGIVLVKWRV